MRVEKRLTPSDHADERGPVDVAQHLLNYIDAVAAPLLAAVAGIKMIDGILDAVQPVGV